MPNQDNSSESQTNKAELFNIFQKLAVKHNFTVKMLAERFTNLYEILSESLHDRPLPHDEDTFVIPYGN